MKPVSVSPTTKQDEREVEVFGVEESGGDDREAEDEDEMLERSGVFDDEEEIDEIVGGARGASSSGVPKGGGLLPPSSEPGIEEPGEQEGRRLRPQSSPYVPTAAERREHRKTHFPPRSWCKHCVEASGMAAPHHRCPDEAGSGVGELHFDYCFLRNRAREDPAVTLVGVDKYTQGVLAHIVPGKGTAFDWVAAQLDRDVRK